MRRLREKWVSKTAHTMTMSLAQAIEQIKQTLSLDDSLKGKAAIDFAKESDPRLAGIDGTLRSQVAGIAQLIGILPLLGAGWAEELDPSNGGSGSGGSSAAGGGGESALPPEIEAQIKEARNQGQAAVRARDWCVCLTKGDSIFCGLAVAPCRPLTQVDGLHRP